VPKITSFNYCSDKTDIQSLIDASDSLLLICFLEAVPTVPVNGVMEIVGLDFAFYAVERIADEPEYYSGDTAGENKD
jgi:hypothetical protein